MKVELGSVLQNVEIVSLNIHGTTGNGKLQCEDLGVEEVPKNLINLGSKKILPPVYPRKLEKYRREAKRFCGQTGIRFGNSGTVFMVPVNRVDELELELKRITEEAREIPTMIDQNYDSDVDEWLSEPEVQEWLQATPGLEEKIRHSMPSKSELKSRFSFEYTWLGDETGLVDILYEEIAKRADTLWQASYKGKHFITRHALRPLKGEIRKKLDGLRFLDMGIGNIIDRIDNTMAALPKTGKIEGNDFAATEALVLLLRDSVNLHECAKSSIQSTSSQDLLANLTQTIVKEQDIEEEIPDAEIALENNESMPVHVEESVEVSTIEQESDEDEFDISQISNCAGSL